MFKRFVSLEWKQFIRSSNFQRGVVINIFLILGALYLLGLFLILGVSAYFGFQKGFPDQDPVVLINNYLIFWFLFDLLMRFFMQKLPVMNIKPLMVFPIERKTMIHYLLGKTLISFFNFLPIFFFLPLSVVLLTQGYSPVHVIPWFLALVCFELCINYVNFLINKSNIIFYVLLVTLLALASLQYFDVYPVIEPIGFFFNKIFNTPYAVLIPLILLILLYRRVYEFVRKDFYVDGKVSKSTKEAKTAELGWLDRFGDLAVFLKNDIRMIWRNKRPRQVLLMAVVFLGYGLLFYTQDIYRSSPSAIAFASLFITAGFLFTFGNYVPSWDSKYYKLLMSQNITYRKYLESKWYLMVVGTGISFVLTTPYLYFGWDIFGMIAAAALFNIGLNTFITLYAGALNRVPVELNVKAKAFGNTQNFSATQFIMILPKLVLPVILFYVPYYIFNFEAGLIVLGLSGVLGLVFKNFFLDKIEKVYQKGKYKTLAAYEEKK